jgi:hypothetical protein
MDVIFWFLLMFFCFVTALWIGRTKSTTRPSPEIESLFDNLRRQRIIVGYVDDAGSSSPMLVFDAENHQFLTQGHNREQLEQGFLQRYPDHVLVLIVDENNKKI